MSGRAASRPFAGPAAGPLAAFTAALGLAACGGPEVPRHVLMVSLDTLRADRVGAYGHERDTTPFIDSLAREGLVFERAHAPSPRTAPSHMSLFTGLDPEAHGIWNVESIDTSRDALSGDVPTLPERFAAAGYRTASFTDTGNIHPVLGFGRGFEFQSNYLANFAQKLPAFEGFLRAETGADAPLFCFLHTYEPHAPYVPPRAFRGRYTDPSYSGPFLQRYEALAEVAATEAYPASGDFLKGFEGMGERDFQFLSDLYDENVAHVDDVLQRFWRVWDGLMDGDATLLVLLSDHGEAFGEHGLLGHQGELTEELLHVPLIFRGPGVVAGRSDLQVTLTDVAPTLVEFLGLPAAGADGAAPMQGCSFAGVLAGGTVESEPVYHQLYLRGRGFRVDAVSDGRTRMRLRRIQDEESATLGGALIDIKRDPLGRRDTTDSRPQASARLQLLLDGRRETNAERLAARPPAVQGELEEAERAELEALGYTGG